MVVHSEPGPGWVVEATVAATTASADVKHAVNELLLREGHDATLFLPVSALHGSCGSESPAGSTVALILDSGNGTLRSPVPAIWGSKTFKWGDLLDWEWALLNLESFHLWLESKKLLVFLIRPIGHVVDTDSVTSGNLVVLLYHLE